MTQRPEIDIAFDFTTDTPPGLDPDTHSPTLRKYHQQLWSKRLPSGILFTLSTTTPHAYLHHASEAGEFWLSSDAVVPEYTRASNLTQIIATIPSDDVRAFHHLGYTIGGMMVFPSERVDNKMTINGARGFHPRIRDRFDLTVECIRRLYAGEESPLSAVLTRYRRFFALFGSFDTYVDFFLLQDITTGSAVRFHLPFEGFDATPLPRSVEEYVAYRDNASNWIRARNARIHDYWTQQS